MAAMAITLVLVGAASFLPDKRLWGLNHLAFYPVYVRMIAIALAAAAFIPSVARCMTRVFEGAVDRLRDSSAPLKAAAPLAALISFCAFWFLRSSTLLLGDARLVAGNFEHAFDPGYEVIVSSPRIILSHEPIAKGTALLYHYAARGAIAAFGAGAVDGIRLLNCALGAIFIYVLLRVALKKPAPGFMTAWTLVLVLTSGAIEVYFGYIENYTPVILFGSLYMLAGIAYLQGGKVRHLTAALAGLILAAFMHVQGILLAPSLVLLLAWRFSKPGRRGMVFITMALFGMTTIGASFFAALTAYGKHFLPVLANDETFGMLSASHLADMANEVLLLLPTALVTVGLAVDGARRRRSRARAGTEESAGQEMTRPGRLHFILAALFPCALFLLVFKPDLGMARDWDLFAILSLGLVPLAANIADSATAGDGRRLMMRLAPPAAVLSVVLALAWVGVNADPDRSARRFEAVLGYDLTRAPYAYEVLAQHYRHAGDMDRAIATMERGIASSYNLRLMSLAAVLYDETGDTDKAVRLYTDVLERQPGLEGTRRNFVLLLHKLDRRDELRSVSREGVRYHPEKPIYHYFYGLTLIDAGDVERGIEELLICRRLNPGSDVITRVNNMLKRLETMGYDTEDRDSPTEFKMPEPG
ncbi:MAG: tetratricopeptide repeat protein [bacterium]|jgi:tetratricopeptide (TPR) repeat protein